MRYFNVNENFQHHLAPGTASAGRWRADGRTVFRARGAGDVDVKIFRRPVLPDAVAVPESPCRAWSYRDNVHCRNGNER